MIGTYGSISVQPNGRGGFVAKTRFRDLDGRLRPVKGTGSTRSAASAALKKRLLDRPGYGAGGLLDASSGFGELVDLWLEDLESREIVENTKDNYRDDIRLHVQPWFAHYTLGEVSTGRIEQFLRAEAAVSYSRAKHSRTALNQLFTFAMRHDAMTRNPVEGTSALTRPKKKVRALTLEQVQAIRAAAAAWRAGPGVKDPKPDGQVRDFLEVLLGSSMRPGEVLALRPCDITDGEDGMIAAVNGTVVPRKGAPMVRQDHPKTHASVRRVPVAEFAAAVLRGRLATMDEDQAERTIFANRTGGPLSLHNVRRTFREFLDLAGLKGSGISPRWYRRTGATVLARGLGVDVAADYLGHASTTITTGHYIEPDTRIDFATARLLQTSLRPDDPDGALLARSSTAAEERALDQIDPVDVDIRKNVEGAGYFVPVSTINRAARFAAEELPTDDYLRGLD